MVMVLVGSSQLEHKEVVHVGRRSRLDGFEAVVTSQQGSLLRLAHALCGNWAVAEDCVASAFARVWPRWSRGHIDDIDSYLRRAVMNEVASWHRRRLRDLARLPRLARSQEHVEGPAERSADSDWISRALLALPFHQRQVVALRYLEDRSEADVARLLGVPVGTVKSRLGRALQAMRSAGRSSDGAEEEHV